MKEHPIIMSSELVPKVLDGTKTQTRRTRGLDGINRNPDNWIYKGFVEGCADFSPKVQEGYKSGLTYHIKCSYSIGDRLWVRETWKQATIQPPFCKETTQLRYKADYLDSPDTAYWVKWRPSIHMFRKDSRINLDITNLRAELLLGISEADARAEGFNSIEEFLIYWDIKNKKRGYGRDANPWVWPIEFKLLKGG